MAPGLQPTNGYMTFGWMVTDLHLEGVELSVFAIVYNFSQGRAGRYVGGTRYLCEWLGITKPTALKYLASLCDRGLIERHEKAINGVVVVEYTLGKEFLPPVKNLDGGVKNFYTEYKDNIPPYVSISDKSSIDTAPQGAVSQKDILRKFEERGCAPALLQDWVAARKGAKVTQSVLDGMQREADKAGISLAEAVRICAENSWRGFRADYLHRNKTADKPSAMDNFKETARRLGFDIYGRTL